MQFLHNSGVSVSVSLIQNRMTAVQPLKSRQQKRPLFQTPRQPLAWGLRQGFALDGDGQRGPAEMLTGMAAPESSVNSKPGRLQPCMCHGSNPGLNSAGQESPRAKSQTLRAQHRLNPTAFNRKNFTSLPTWKTLIWCRVGESDFLTSIPSSVADTQLSPSRRWDGAP